MKKLLLSVLSLVALLSLHSARAIDHPSATQPVLSADRFTLVADSQPLPIFVASTEDKAILRAVNNLSLDFERVTGRRAEVGEAVRAVRAVLVGSLHSALADELVRRGKFDRAELVGCTEKYWMATVEQPIEGVGEALVILGSDRRGVVYGIYELS
ncbi:MAG: glycosyhydrolase, partial [Alistipes sp.]|nr:glycosyhydrolase [Alistipes sp.]